MIEVKQTGAGDLMEFEVVVREANGTTRHHVTMKKSTFERFATKATAVRFVEAAFAFLLEHEPKESILARFDVTVIRRYFPQFEREIGRYLD